MMQFDPILEFLFQYWLVIFISLFMFLVVSVIMITYILHSKIRTWIFVLKVSTATVEIGKEIPDGTQIITSKRKIAKLAEPFVWKHGWRIERVFFVNDKENETLDLKMAAFMLKQLKEGKKTSGTESTQPIVSADWSTIFESEAIRQAVAVLAADNRQRIINLIIGLLIGLPFGALLTIIFT